MDEMKQCKLKRVVPYYSIVITLLCRPLVSRWALILGFPSKQQAFPLGEANYYSFSWSDDGVTMPIPRPVPYSSPGTTGRFGSYSETQWMQLFRIHTQLVPLIRRGGLAKPNPRGERF